VHEKMLTERFRCKWSDAIVRASCKFPI